MMNPEEPEKYIRDLERRAMRDLERAFPGAGPGNWEPVRDASVPDIERAIAIENVGSEFSRLSFSAKPPSRH